MNEDVDALLRAPYWIADILPARVPEDSPGQYFAVERYYLTEPRLSAVKQKHIDLVLKLNCYRSIFLYEPGLADPPPEVLSAQMRGRYLSILTDGAMIVSQPDETYLTVYNPDDALLSLLRTLAAGEGLYLWQPPD